MRKSTAAIVAADAEKTWWQGCFSATMLS